MSLHSIFKKDYDNILHVIIMLTCCASYPYLGNAFGYSTEQVDEYRIVYMFSHSNLLHLALNVSAYYFFSRRLLGSLYSPMCLLIGYLATFGTEMTLPTIGLSGVCYAQMGVLTVYYFKQKWCIEMLVSALLINVLGFFMESINYQLHLLSLAYSIVLTIILKYTFYARGGNKE